MSCVEPSNIQSCVEPSNTESCVEPSNIESCVDSNGAVSKHGMEESLVWSKGIISSLPTC